MRTVQVNRHDGVISDEYPQNAHIGRGNNPWGCAPALYSRSRVELRTSTTSVYRSSISHDRNVRCLAADFNGRVLFLQAQAPTAPVVVVGMKHEVIDDELAAAGEQVWLQVWEPPQLAFLEASPYRARASRRVSHPDSGGETLSENVKCETACCAMSNELVD